MLSQYILVRNCVVVGDVYCLIYYVLLPTHIKPSFPVVFWHKTSHANVITTDHSFCNKRNSMPTSYKDHFYITKKRETSIVKWNKETMLWNIMKAYYFLCSKIYGKWEHWDKRFLFLNTKTFIVKWMIFPPMFRTFQIMVVKLFVWISQSKSNAVNSFPCSCCDFIGFGIQSPFIFHGNF